MKSETAVLADLGERTQRVYRELVNFIDQHGYVPTYAELAERLRCGKTTVHWHMGKLEAAGLIERPGGKGRARCVVVKLVY